VLLEKSDMADPGRKSETKETPFSRAFARLSSLFPRPPARRLSPAVFAAETKARRNRNGDNLACARAGAPSVSPLLPVKPRRI
jgi:hypothetical protein